jgi:hypothetical protein
VIVPPCLFPLIFPRLAVLSPGIHQIARLCVLGPIVISATEVEKRLSKVEDGLEANSELTDGGGLYRLVAQPEGGQAFSVGLAEFPIIQNAKPWLAEEAMSGFRQTIRGEDDNNL